MRRVLSAVGVLLLVCVQGAAASAAPQTRWLDAPVPLEIAAVFSKPASEWGPGHRGIDLYSLEDAQVRSPGPGIITFAGDVAGRGVVVVLHPTGLRSSLEPVAASVTVGQSVSAGSVVGTVELRQSHCAPRACVHWGVRDGDDYLDPLDVLRGYGPIRLLPLRE